jgi:hypothetical protein
MYELVIIACLIAHPARCEEFVLPVDGAAGIMQCMREGELELARWSADRPDWVIRRWRCGLPRA